MNIDVANLEKVTTAECLGCQECVNACPVDGALSSKMGKADIPKVLAPIAAAAVFSGGLVLASSISSQGGGHPSWFRGRPRLPWGNAGSK